MMSINMMNDNYQSEALSAGTIAEQAVAVTIGGSWCSDANYLRGYDLLSRHGRKLELKTDSYASGNHFIERWGGYNDMGPEHYEQHKFDGGPWGCKADLFACWHPKMAGNNFFLYTPSAIQDVCETTGLQLMDVRSKYKGRQWLAQGYKIPISMCKAALFGSYRIPPSVLPKTHHLYENIP